MIGIIAVGTAVRDVFAKRTAQARAPPAVEVVLLSYILRDTKLFTIMYCDGLAVQSLKYSLKPKFIRLPKR